MGRGRPAQADFLNPGLGLISAGRALPLHISAFGPRGMALTAREADGWLTFFGPVARAVAQAAHVDAACGAAGREPRSLYRTAFTLGCVLGPGEPADSSRALAQAGPVVAVSYHGMTESGLVPPGMEDALARYRVIYEGYTPATARCLDLHEGHLLYVRPEERPFITADLIRASSFTGTPAELRDGLRALAAAGYDQVAVQLVHGHEHALEEWARLFDTV